MYGKTLIMYIYALTPLHPGSGVSLSGLVDQPIQRERHTNFPIIQGSSLKGVLRTYAKHKLEEGEVQKLFGKEDRVGGVSVSDARVLAFPVRSLKGVFAWVTCPMVLDRYISDMCMSNTKVDWDLNEVTPEEHQAIVNEGSGVVANGKVFLEEVMLDATEKNLSEIINHLMKGIPDRRYIRELFRRNFVIVTDDLFTELVELTTEVIARIKIHTETKTVEGGHLWYEEYIPSDTLMYSMIMIPHRYDINEITKLLNQVFSQERKIILNIGGDETVGKGFAEVRLYE